MSLCLRIFLAILVTWGIVTLPGGVAGARDAFRLIPFTRFHLGMEWSVFRVSGDLLIPAGGRPGSGMRLDIGSDLGIDWSEGTSLFLRGALFDAHHFELEHLTCSLTGSRAAVREFTFHNKAYLQGTQVESRLDLNWSRFGYAYRAVDMAPRWLAPRIGVHYVHLGATLNAETKETGLFSNTRQLDAVYPVVGLEMGYMFPLGVDLKVELEGMHFIVGGFVAAARFAATWEVHPDISLSLSGFSRTVSCVETNQKLNNEWTFSLLGIAGGIAFGF